MTRNGADVVALTVIPKMSLPPLPKLSVPQYSIRFGHHEFNGPFTFPPMFLLPAPGIYAVLVQDPGWTPRPFRPLYIGQSIDLHGRLSVQHEKYPDWMREARGLALHYAYFTTTLWTDKQRKDVEAELIAWYDPPCNKQYRAFAPSILRDLI